MRLVWMVFMSATLCAVGGCGKTEGPPVAPAEGIVTYKGEPVADARVMFHPKEGGARTSYGTTNASGRFKMSTFGSNDGALVGPHTVTVSKVEQPQEVNRVDVEEMQKRGMTAMPGYDSAMGIGGRESPKPQSLIPEVYGQKEKTPLEANVTADGRNEFTFELTE